MFTKFLISIQFFFIWYFTILNLVYLFLIVLGSFKVYKRKNEVESEDFTSILHSESLPEITLIIPVYNELDQSVENIRNMTRLTYRYKKIIIVNDGSADDSLNALLETFQMTPIPKLYESPLETQSIRQVYQSKTHPEIILLDKEHGGKFDASNAGINATTSAYFIVIDADTFIDDIGFKAMIRPILMDDSTVCVGSSIHLKNECELDYNRISTLKFPKTYLVSMQGIEYMRSFLTRQGWDFFNANFIVAGAFSLFQRDLIVDIGGFANSVGEDVEIVIKLHRKMKERKQKYKIFHLPDPIAWTMAPETWGELKKQRVRWHLAVLEPLFFHKRMLFNPKYGFIGLVVYPFWLFGEMLDPVIETIGYFYILSTWYLGILNASFFFLYLAMSLGIILLYTIYCLLVEDLGFRKYPSIRSFLLLFTSCLVENIGYHQIGLIWRLQGFIEFFKRLPKVIRTSRTIN
ncbi:MAG: glycosyltransferase family 2 protein [Simkaniaceae bacterium]|nr:glycosyltransferase family 2 protein [Simkaniaceae bacterium]